MTEASPESKSNDSSFNSWFKAPLNAGDFTLLCCVGLVGFSKFCPSCGHFIKARVWSDNLLPATLFFKFHRSKVLACLHTELLHVHLWVGGKLWDLSVIDCGNRLSSLNYQRMKRNKQPHLKFKNDSLKIFKGKYHVAPLQFVFSFPNGDKNVFFLKR